MENKISNKSFWICLFAGTIAYILCNGYINIPIMAWIYPFFFLYISRSSTPLKGLGLTCLAIILAELIKIPGGFFFGFPEDQIVASLTGIVVIVPFILDRIFYPKFVKNGGAWRRFAGTFVFPLLYVTMCTLLNYYIFGAYGSVAASQTDNLPLIQISALLGQAGISFTITWTASMAFFVITYIKEHRATPDAKIWQNIKKPIAIFLIVWLAVFTYGGIRLSYGAPKSDTVKIAVANGPKETYSNGIWTVPEYKECVEWVKTAVHKAKNGEAQIVAFNECAFFLYNQYENDFKQVISNQAKKDSIYVLAGLEVGYPSYNQLAKNKIVMFSPDGKVMFEYSKSYLVPIIEDKVYAPGNFDIPIVDIPLCGDEPTQVSAAISYEGHFSQYINKLGGHPDIHINPSNGWEGTSTVSRSAMQLRAIEHGMSIVIPTTQNTNACYDYLGRMVSRSVPDYSGYDAVNFAFLPSQGLYTFYGYFGPIIDWTFVGATLVFCVLAVIRHCKEKKKTEPVEENGETIGQNEKISKESNQ